MRIKNRSLRARLTILSVLLLTICCVGLTTILNLSANRMANKIEATLIMPPSIQNTDEIRKEAASEQGTQAIPLVPVETSQEARSHFLQQSVFYMSLVVVMGGALTYGLSGRALNPLRQLSVQMKKRTVHNLSECLPVPESHDEISDLTLSFNEMSKKLEDAFAMQKRFSQSAAHELRTPLTVLKTKVEVFQKKQSHTPEEYTALFSVITNHTNRLSDLVKELLDFTNLDAMDCNEPIALKELLLETCEELSALAKEKNVSIQVDGEEQMLSGNRSLLGRAFYNLLENAIKYNTQDGRVEVRLTALGARRVVTVSDTGIGIPEKLQDFVFEPFYRVDPSRSRQMGGAGLGLSIVKAIVEKHGGEITLHNHTSGGVAFEVTL